MALGRTAMRWTRPTPRGASLKLFIGALVGGALLGALVYWLTTADIDAALLTFFGVLITAGAKDLIDTRSEQRLRLDAAMEAGKLLSPASGMKVSPAAAASGLLALTDLGKSKLAVSMLVDLWAGNRVPPEVAVLVIDKALATRDDSTAHIAAEVLSQNAQKLDPTKSAHWPSVLDESWVAGASEKTKILLVEALIEMSTNTIVHEPDLHALRSFTLRMMAMHEKEGSGDLRHCLARLVGAVVAGFEDDVDGDGLSIVFVDGKLKADREVVRRIGGERADYTDRGDVGGADDATAAGRMRDTYYQQIEGVRRSQIANWAKQCRRNAVVPKVGAMAATPCNWGAGSDSRGVQRPTNRRTLTTAPPFGARWAR